MPRRSWECSRRSLPVGAARGARRPDRRSAARYRNLGRRDVALGLLVRDGDSYRNGEVAAAYLSGHGPADLRPVLRFWERISYPNLARLAQARRTGSAGLGQLTDEQGEVFSAGVEAITARAARAMVDTYDLRAHHRILDVGGGTGSFLLAALDRHPDLTGTLVEIEPVLSVARARVAAGPHADRIDVVGADALVDPLPGGHDALLVANLAHMLSPERTASAFAPSHSPAPACC